MDDLLDMNTDIREVHEAHNTVNFLTKKKNMPLNEKKCNMMIINQKPPFATPILHVNRKKMETEDSIRYLGDVFNNTDLIQDHINKGTKCLINSMRAY